MGATTDPTELDTKAKKAVYNKRKKANAKKNKDQLSAKLRLVNSVIPPGQVFEIKPSSQHGLGMFAAQDIKSGTEILREAPMWTVENEDTLCLEAAFALLSDEKKQLFLALHDHCSCQNKPCLESEVLRRFVTNSFEVAPTDTASSKRYFFIYEIVSRLNHSCFPNVARGFTEELYISICAVENIQKGDEIIYNYIATGGAIACSKRRPRLFEKYRFIYSCRGASIGTDLPSLLIARYRGFLRAEITRFEKEGRKASLIRALS